jgi:hypothetical protein
MADASANTLKELLESLSQNHPAKALLDSWPIAIKGLN